MSTGTRSERARLLDALLEEMAAKGCRGVQVKKVMRRAGVADHDVGDQHSLLFAAFDRLIERLVACMKGRCVRAESWEEGVRLAIEALLQELARNPGMTQMAMRSFPALRPEAHVRYMELLKAFAPFLEEGRRVSGVEGELPAEVEMLAIGAAEAIILDAVLDERTAELPSLVPSILFSVLTPFLGPERASSAMRNAARAA